MTSLRTIIKSVEELINPFEHPLDPYDNYEKDPTIPTLTKANLLVLLSPPRTKRQMNIFLMMTHTTTMLHLSWLQTSLTALQSSLSPPPSLLCYPLGLCPFSDEGFPYK